MAVERAMHLKHELELNLLANGLALLLLIISFSCNNTNTVTPLPLSVSVLQTEQQSSVILDTPKSCKRHQQPYTLPSNACLQLLLGGLYKYNACNRSLTIVFSSSHFRCRSGCDSPSISSCVGGSRGCYGDLSFICSCDCCPLAPESLIVCCTGLLCVSQVRDAVGPCAGSVNTLVRQEHIPVVHDIVLEHVSASGRICRLCRQLCAFCLLAVV